MNEYKIAKLYSKMIRAEHWHQRLVDISNLVNKTLDDEYCYISIEKYGCKYTQDFLNDIQRFFPEDKENCIFEYTYKITWLGLWKLNYSLERAYKKQCKAQEKYWKTKGVTWNY